MIRYAVLTCSIFQFFVNERERARDDDDREEIAGATEKKTGDFPHKQPHFIHITYTLKRILIFNNKVKQSGAERMWRVNGDGWFNFHWIFSVQTISWCYLFGAIWTRYFVPFFSVKLLLLWQWINIDAIALTMTDCMRILLKWVTASFWKLCIHSESNRVHIVAVYFHNDASTAYYPSQILIVTLFT